MNGRFFIYLLGLFVALTGTAAQGALRPHGLFVDHAVIQRQAKVPVWGTTDRPERVVVQLAGQEASADPKDGQWRVELPPMAEGGPHVLSITQGEEKIEVHDVMVGEVWLCAGQSNMRWPLKQSAAGQDAIAAPHHPRIRLLTVPDRHAPSPQTDLEAHWQTATPPAVEEFSAIGFYFGRALEHRLDVSIGLIAVTCGGSTAEQWTSLAALEEHEELAEMSRHNASTLYNGMLMPLVPYAIRGVIWCQGESNAGRAHQYRALLPATIKCWRDTFAQGDFPFLIAQFAPYELPVAGPSESMWAELRDAQFQVARTVPKCALAVTIDVGDERDIHPRRKQPVGERLALAARALAYDERIEYSGPVYDSMTINGDQVTIHFKHAGRGLLAKDGPIEGFTIAGADQKFRPAEAVIVDDTVVVYSPHVCEPTAVRYGWAAYPIVNLWNRDGLPASPFRTDTFPITTQGKH